MMPGGRYLVAVVATLGGMPVVAAQAASFDRARAWVVDTTVFLPFVVTATFPLREALAARRVNDDTPVLVFETAAGPLALVTAQMAYHHLAQGQEAGEPWLVSF